MPKSEDTVIDEAYHLIGLYVLPICFLLFAIGLWIMMPKPPLTKGKNPYINEAKRQEEIQDSLRKKSHNEP